MGSSNDHPACPVPSSSPGRDYRQAVEGLGAQLPEGATIEVIGGGLASGYLGCGIGSMAPEQRKTTYAGGGHVPTTQLDP